jgi:hypothetical protein
MTKQVKSEKPTKWEVVYENEKEISIWKYDSKITTHGPISVEHKWKKGFEPISPNKKKTLGDLVNEDKKVLKSNRPKP